MIEREDNNNEIFSSNNQAFTDYNALQVRLNTQPILKQLEFYLRGVEERVEAHPKTGEPVIMLVQVTEPKMNATGIHNLMAWVSTLFNTQIVQGNIQKFEDLYDFVSNFRMDLADYIMNNLYDWELDLNYYEGIIDMITNMTRQFLSRLVNDGERRSYVNTIQHKESSSNTVDKRGGGGFRIPGFR